MEEKNNQYQIRKDKLNKLRDSGIEPYPTKFAERGTASSALSSDEKAIVRVAGRIITKRVMGKASFANIADSTGKIQIYVVRDNVGEGRYKLFKETDLGDFIGVEGEIFITRTGEKTILVKNFDFLSKSLRPLPEKWHGLKDVEIRYRKRYLDILVNKESSNILRSRTLVMDSIRKVLRDNEFIEVETPILQAIAGGAAARPFITHHNTFNRDLFLRIAPELYLKRLLVGGWDKVFEIGRNFRNEGISNRHNPEFSMLEVYCAYEDFSYMMDLSKNLIIETASALKKQGFKSEIDFEEGWSQENLWDLLTEHTGMEFTPDDSFEDLKKKAEKLDVPPGKDSSEKIIDRVFSKYVEHKLIQPTFLTGFLAEHSPLAKKMTGNDIFAERFEIYIAGQEIGNAYSEQNDPVVQKKMFENQLSESEIDIDTIDNDYIEALEHGMPPAAGLGIGIDRLLMLITGAESIRDVILFPMLKPEKGE